MRFVQPNTFLYFFLLVLAISGFFFAVAWPQAEGFYAFIAFAAAGGFGVAAYIRYTKAHHKQLVCPVGSNCNTVIMSRYAKFFGVSLEYWGMLYYGILLLSYIGLILAPVRPPQIFLSGLTLLTVGAFLFSLYLLFVQAFILRQWCIWCLLSAMLCIVIFITVMAGVGPAAAFLAQAAPAIEIVRALGFALGVGGGTTALFLFTRFVRNLDLDPEEVQTLKGVLELIWVGLALALISQFAAYASSAESLSAHPPFLAQTVALFLAVMSGAVLMIIFAPFMAAIPLHDPAKGQPHSPLESMRKPMFATGAIALSSWYFAFAMNYSAGGSLAVLFAALALALAVGIGIALAWERALSTKTA